MSQEAQAFQDFILKQQAILAAYQAGIQSLANDRAALTRQMLLAAQGLSVFEAGCIPAKCDKLGSSLTDFTNPFCFSFSFFTSLSVYRLNLQGAKKVKLAWSVNNYAQIGVEPLGPETGLYGVFSTTLVGVPPLTEFSPLTRSTAVSVGSAVNTLALGNGCGTTECETAKYLYLIFPVTFVTNPEDGFSPGSFQGYLTTYAAYQLLR